MWTAKPVSRMPTSSFVSPSRMAPLPGFAGPLCHGHVDLVGPLHLLEAHLGGNGHGILQEPGHQGGLGLGHLARAAPARHPCIGPLEDHLLELRERLVEHLLIGDVGPGRALAQGTVTPGTAIEVDELRLPPFLVAQYGDLDGVAGRSPHKAQESNSGEAVKAGDIGSMTASHFTPPSIG